MFLILFDTFYILKTDVFIHECAFKIQQFTPTTAGRLNKGGNAFLPLLSWRFGKICNPLED